MKVLKIKDNRVDKDVVCGCSDMEDEDGRTLEKSKRLKEVDAVVDDRAQVCPHTPISHLESKERK